MITLHTYHMQIWVKDGRYQSGRRLFNTYVYRDKHEQWMREEIRDLQAGLYPSPKYSIEAIQVS